MKFLFLLIKGVRAWVILFALLLPFAVTGTCAGQEDNAMSCVEIEQKWGIRPLGIWLSAGDNMLDFRYRVFDAEKAAPLFTRQIKPYILDQATGAKFFVPETPKVGALRQTRKPYPDKNYFIIFGNPAKYVKRGGKVTVVIGELQIRDLVVQ
jgi:hypothetical protein